MSFPVPNPQLPLVPCQAGSEGCEQCASPRELRCSAHCLAKGHRSLNQQVGVGGQAAASSTAHIPVCPLAHWCGGNHWGCPAHQRLGGTMAKIFFLARGSPTLQACTCCLTPASCLLQGLQIISSCPCMPVIALASCGSSSAQ